MCVACVRRKSRQECHILSKAWLELFSCLETCKFAHRTLRKCKIGGKEGAGRIDCRIGQGQVRPADTWASAKAPAGQLAQFAYVYVTVFASVFLYLYLYLYLNKELLQKWLGVVPAGQLTDLLNLSRLLNSRSLLSQFVTTGNVETVSDSVRPGPIAKHYSS